MSRLQAQSAVLTRTNTQQTAVMKDYTAAVKGLRTEYGTTTTEAAKLVETLSKVTNMRKTRDLQDLSKVFVEMSHATGESSEGLASSLTNLQRVMGTPINSKNARTYADQFTYLAAQTNTSAQGLIDFTAQLAPTARAMGMAPKQIDGLRHRLRQGRAGQWGRGQRLHQDHLRHHPLDADRVSRDRALRQHAGGHSASVQGHGRAGAGPADPGEAARGGQGRSR